MSGPAIYKHFDGKEALLRAVLVGISEQLLDEGVARRETAGSPEAALDALIAWHIDFALGNPAYIVVQEREWSTMGPQGRDQVRRLQRAYIDVWVGVLRELRPELDRATARAATQAVFGLLNSTPHSARIDQTAMRELLAAMARSALYPQAEHAEA